jgi:sortase A
MKRSHYKKAMVQMLLIPLLFSLAVTITLYLIAKPVVDLSLAVASMTIAGQVPEFEDSLTSIYTDKDIVERNVVPLADVVIPYIGTHYASIQLKRIGMNVPLYWGDNDRILRFGAGQYTGSFLPGFQKPLLIGGHNLSIFRKLSEVLVKDQIIIKTNYGVYIYEVDEITIKKADDPSFYDLSLNEEQLILYTCYPFTVLSRNKDIRYVVYGHRVSGPDIKDVNR